jgi:hypothetical protein
MRGSGNGDGERNRRRTCHADHAGGGQPDPTPQVIPSCDPMMFGHSTSESLLGRESANTYCFHRNSIGSLRLF